MFESIVASEIGMVKEETIRDKVKIVESSNNLNAEVKSSLLESLSKTLDFFDS